MFATAKLLLPPKELASFIAAAIYRDTRATALNDAQRMNFFPATPLLTLTLVLEGRLHTSCGICDISDLQKIAPNKRISVALPSDEPTVSWSPGAVVVLTLAIYPDAWAKLTRLPYATAIPPTIDQALSQIETSADIETAFKQFCHDVSPIWEENRGTGPFSGWVGSDRIADWTRHVVATSAMAQRGRSTRSIERMLRLWTGQSRRSLEFYAKLEKLHQTRQRSPGAELVHTALDADFADQSHMGRSLKRATGFSPARLNERIATEESFWCYRLLGERF